MSNSFINKVLDAFGLADEEQYIGQDTDENLKEGQEEEFWGTGHKKDKIVSIHSNRSPKVSVFKLNKFEDVVIICDWVKGRNTAIVNLKDLEQVFMQRCVDFLSGVIHILDGDIQEISPWLLLLTPSNVNVSPELKERISDQGLFLRTYKED